MAQDRQHRAQEEKGTAEAVHLDLQRLDLVLLALSSPAILLGPLGEYRDLLLKRRRAGMHLLNQEVHVPDRDDAAITRVLLGHAALLCTRCRPSPMIIPCRCAASCAPPSERRRSEERRVVLE